MAPNSAARSAEGIFQGVMYFFRSETIRCLYQITLKEEVDPGLLQAAQDAVLARTDYFRVQLVQEKRETFLAPNDRPCPVGRGSRLPEIPEETGGYLFHFSCEGNTVSFSWHHFIADGKGISRFLTQVLEEYCNRRYGAAFPCPPLASSPFYDPEELFARFPGCDVKNDMQGEVPSIAAEPMQRTMVRLDRESLIRRALGCGVKPFSCLTALLTLATGQYLDKQEVTYSYSADTRGDLGVPDAFYNCVASFQGRAEFGPEPRLEDFVQAVDARVKETLLPENKLGRMAEQMHWIYQVAQLKAPLRIKQRVFQMGEYLGGVPADFWISYLGCPFSPASPELMDYIEDFEVWVPPDGASMGVEAASINGQIILCIQDKTGRAGLAETLRSVMEQEGVRVLEAKDLILAPA